MKLTKDELFYIERTADIEASFCLDKFANLQSIDHRTLNKKEKEMVRYLSDELMDLYLFLRKLRTKLERERKSEKGGNLNE